ncbi:hypothetical protein FRB97_004826 [Tulasnella sp. 331]|nr:hypothetical protein FRB97_004826 [Tulasnella sp. 331]
MSDLELSRQERSLHSVLAKLLPYRIDPQDVVVDEASTFGPNGFGVLKRACYTRSTSAVVVRRLSSTDLPTQRVVLVLLRKLHLNATLRHPHLLNLIGYYLSPSKDSAIIITPLEPFGDVNKFIQRERPKDAQRLELSNVLVDRHKRAILCDLGLAEAMGNISFVLATSAGLRNSIRWCAPELLNDDSRSTESDIWAWGGLLLEILKDKMPYYWIKSDVTVIGAISNGTLPEQKNASKHTIDIWPVLRRCWELDPAKRASAVSCLQSIYSASLEDSFEVRIYPRELTTRRIMKQCQGFGDHDSKDGTVESTIYLKRLATILDNIDQQRVKIKKGQYNRAFQDAMTNFEPGKGISYANMLLVLNRYRTPKDVNAHRVQAPQHRRAYAEFINNMVKIELAHSVLKGYVCRRRFLAYRTSRELTNVTRNEVMIPLEGDITPLEGMHVEGRLPGLQAMPEIPDLSTPEPPATPLPTELASQCNVPPSMVEPELLVVGPPPTNRGSPSVPHDIPDISDTVQMANETSVARGGFYAVYRGRHVVEGDVALRLPLEDLKYESKDLERRFWREANIWFHLRHKNISRLLGVYQDHRGYFMVSPWQENGCITDCIKREHPVDHLKVLRGIADALMYLHSMGFAHGDLKLENVLLSFQGDAVLNDFGLTRQTEMVDKTTTALTHAGNFRWFAPEIIEGGRKSTEGDIYAFGMVIAEAAGPPIPISSGFMRRFASSNCGSSGPTAGHMIRQKDQLRRKL